MLHILSYYLMVLIASKWCFNILSISYLITCFLFIVVGKCPFEIAVQFKWVDYIKACRRIYGKKFILAVIGYCSYPVLYFVCLIDFFINSF
jgi:hypothetical protein